MHDIFTEKKGGPTTNLYQKGGGPREPLPYYLDLV